MNTQYKVSHCGNMLDYGFVALKDFCQGSLYSPSLLYQLYSYIMNINLHLGHFLEQYRYLNNPHTLSLGTVPDVKR